MWPHSVAEQIKIKACLFDHDTVANSGFSALGSESSSLGGAGACEGLSVWSSRCRTSACSCHSLTAFAVFANFANTSFTSDVFESNSATLGGAVLECVPLRQPRKREHIVSSLDSRRADARCRSYHGATSVVNSTFLNNSAASGGGLYGAVGVMTLTNDSFTANAATNLGTVGVYSWASRTTLRSRVQLSRTTPPLVGAVRCASKVA